MTKDEVIALALEALMKSHTHPLLPDDCEEAITALKQALAELDSDYERGFVDGMNLQTKGSVDKAVNRMAQTTHWEGCEAVHPECRKQEPVGWQWLDTANYRKKLPANAIPEHWRPLYTAPTPRKPLTDDEIADLWDGHTVPVFGKTGINPIVFARALERAHGIGEQHE